MSEDLLGTVLVPIASEDDAAATAEALRPYLDADPEVRVVHVIEKAGGAPDKASVEQREERAERIFGVVERRFADSGVDVTSEVLYGTDVADAVLAAAAEIDASAIAFTPRGASRWLKLVSGDVSGALVRKTDRPVLVLPAPADDPAGDTDG